MTHTILDVNINPVDEIAIVNGVKVLFCVVNKISVELLVA